MGETLIHKKLDRPMWIRPLLATIISLACGGLLAGPPATPVIGAGELRSLTVFPEKVSLRGADVCPSGTSAGTPEATLRC